MVSLLVDFGFFGPFLSPFCDGSFLEAVGPLRLWANTCFSTAHSKAPGNENHEDKETAHGLPTSQFDGHPDSSLLAVIRSLYVFII